MRKVLMLNKTTLHCFIGKELSKLESLSQVIHLHNYQSRDPKYLLSLKAVRKWTSTKL